MTGEDNSDVKCQLQRAEAIHEHAVGAVESGGEPDVNALIARLLELEQLLYSSSGAVLREAVDAFALAVITYPELVANEVDADRVLLRLARLRVQFRQQEQDDYLIREPAIIAMEVLAGQQSV